MDNNQLVTLTISAEEFNRFQDSEGAYTAVQGQAAWAKGRLEELRKENRDLTQQIEALKKQNDLLEESKVLKLIRPDSYDYRNFSNNYEVLLDSTHYHAVILPMVEERIQRIPMWIRRIFKVYKEDIK